MQPIVTKQPLLLSELERLPFQQKAPEVDRGFVRGRGRGSVRRSPEDIGICAGGAAVGVTAGRKGAAELSSLAKGG